jgi:hypothetical protein
VLAASGHEKGVATTVGPVPVVFVGATSLLGVVVAAIGRARVSTENIEDEPEP